MADEFEGHGHREGISPEFLLAMDLALPGSEETAAGVECTSEIVARAAGRVVRSEVVAGHWIRYTVEEKSTGATHCVGSRLTPLISSEDYEALRVLKEGLRGETAS